MVRAEGEFQELTMAANCVSNFAIFRVDWRDESGLVGFACDISVLCLNIGTNDFAHEKELRRPKCERLQAGASWWALGC